MQTILRIKKLGSFLTTKAKLKRYREELQTKTSKKQRFDDKDVPAIGEKEICLKSKEQNRPDEAYEQSTYGVISVLCFDPHLTRRCYFGLTHSNKRWLLRYFDKCEVHCLTFEACTIYMLADRKYPLSKDVCQVMLKMKLLDGKMNEVCYKLLNMIEKQAGIQK
ncbi:hypothetical protein Tco_0614876 [Tanacetum coccineum]